jgi:branched-chain amino acid transport system ATP-binding protein
VSLLQVEHLEVAYGAIQAVSDVSLTVEEGEVVALIGANGAGKTSTLNAISGVVRARGGSMRYDGRDLRRMRPETIVRAGLVQVPEGREVFANMTVVENLEVATWRRRDRAQAAQDIAGMRTRFPILDRRWRQNAGHLSGGEQQILAIARGLVADPRLLLLDEPSLGLAPQRVDEVFDIVTGIGKQGTTILLVEQNALRALDIADRAYVIELGETTLTGTGAELLADPKVRRAYLGV